MKDPNKWQEELLYQLERDNRKNIYCPFCDSPPKTIRSWADIEKIYKKINKSFKPNNKSIR